MKFIPTLVTAVLLAATSLANALEIQPYTPQALESAEKAGQPIALHFHANWCPTCLAQDRTLQGLKAEKGLDLTVLTVDYDTEKDLKRRFNVRTQSTLIVMKGSKEVTTLIGDASADGLRKALKSAL